MAAAKDSKSFGSDIVRVRVPHLPPSDIRDPAELPDFLMPDQEAIFLKLISIYIYKYKY